MGTADLEREIEPPTSINTLSGKVLDYADPRPNAISLTDIAAGLSKVCRFGAQTTEFYSVAQHAIAVSYLTVQAGHTDLALPALHHDSHEAYMCDLPHPLKQLLPEYDVIAARLDSVVAAAFGFDSLSTEDNSWPAVRRWDLANRAVEARHLLPQAMGRVIPTLGEIGEEEIARAEELWRTPLSPADAEREFVATHRNLVGGNRFHPTEGRGL